MKLQQINNSTEFSVHFPIIFVPLKRSSTMTHATVDYSKNFAAHIYST